MLAITKISTSSITAPPTIYRRNDTPEQSGGVYYGVRDRRDGRFYLVDGSLASVTCETLLEYYGHDEVNDRFTKLIAKPGDWVQGNSYVNVNA